MNTTTLEFNRNDLSLITIPIDQPGTYQIKIDGYLNKNCISTDCQILNFSPATINGKYNTTNYIVNNINSTINGLLTPSSETNIKYVELSDIRPIDEQYIEFLKVPSMSKIPDNFMRNCKSLKSLILPDDGSLEEIGDFAFENCYSLTSIVIPDSCVKIGIAAFRNCNAAILIKHNALSVDDYAFEDNTSEILYQQYSNIESSETSLDDSETSLDDSETLLNSSNMLKMVNPNDQRKKSLINTWSKQTYNKVVISDSSKIDFTELNNNQYKDLTENNVKTLVNDAIDATKNSGDYHKIGMEAEIESDGKYSLTYTSYYWLRPAGLPKTQKVIKEEEEKRRASIKNTVDSMYDLVDDVRSVTDNTNDKDQLTYILKKLNEIKNFVKNDQQKVNQNEKLLESSIVGRIVKVGPTKIDFSKDFSFKKYSDEQSEESIDTKNTITNSIDTIESYINKIKSGAEDDIPADDHPKVSNKIAQDEDTLIKAITEDYDMEETACQTYSGFKNIRDLARHGNSQFSAAGHSIAQTFSKDINLESIGGCFGHSASGATSWFASGLDATLSWLPAAIQKAAPNPLTKGINQTIHKFTDSLVIGEATITFVSEDEQKIAATKLLTVVDGNGEYNLSGTAYQHDYVEKDEEYDGPYCKSDGILHVKKCITDEKIAQIADAKAGLKASNAIIEKNKKDIESYQQQYDALKKQFSECDSKTNNSTTKKQNNSSKIKELDEKITRLETEKQKLIKKQTEISTNGQNLEQLSNIANQLKTKYEEITSTKKQKNNLTSSNSFLTGIINNNNSNSKEKITEKLTKINKKIIDAQSIIRAEEQKIENYNKIIDSVSINTNTITLNTSINQHSIAFYNKNAIKEYQNTIQDAIDNKGIRVQKQVNQAKLILNAANSKEITFKDQIDKIYKAFESLFDDKFTDCKNESTLDKCKKPNESDCKCPTDINKIKNLDERVKKLLENTTTDK